VALKYSVDYYERSNGSSPTREAFAAFEKEPVELLDAMMAGIVKLEDAATHSGNLVEHVSSGLWCLSIRVKRRSARLFFTHLEGGQIMLMGGYTSDKKKIPSKQLRTAQSVLKEAINQRRTKC